MITAAQIRMARAALGWGLRDLAEKAGVAANTVSRFENGAGAMVETLNRLQAALEDAGIIFIEADGSAGPGVRFKKATSAPRRRT
jgi:transcriptional regulator with XRE-family HTH domain